MKAEMIEIEDQAKVLIMLLKSCSCWEKSQCLSPNQGECHDKGQFSKPLDDHGDTSQAQGGG